MKSGSVRKIKTTANIKKLTNEKIMLWLSEELTIISSR
jgi:hypothetical protein